ncbi:MULTISPECIES: nuclease-related domain-containing DEAD/DEAH box helicase [Rhodomicrobium]|uniref:3'-5' exonuclease n=1 Tax=Rhodomicrobium TaxID=1068 RepID=UPI000B4BCCF5|nr:MULTISPECIES: nuclease-related domain-containing DEAD/DEAH box helicase [Rhodomicrobium]
MAQMIPERLPARASRGEERLFEILKKLPDDCIVYYEPIVADRYPDFVVIIPSLGVLIVEVKGWYLGWISDADQERVVVNENGGQVRRDHPLQQARKYQYELMDEARRQDFAKCLLHQGGERLGNFLFPFGHFALLTNITREQLDKSDKPAVRQAFSSRRDVTRDVMEEWEALGGEALLLALQARFDPYWPIEPLSPRQVDAIRAVIHPETIISLPAVGGGAGPRDGLDLLKILDLHQEREARNIRSGHRIIRGVAGSGKTVLLLARAKMLGGDGSKRVLLLCYNRALAGYLRSCVSNYPNVTVRHFYEWGRANGIGFKRDEGADDYGQRLLTQLERGEGEAGMFDAVLIDEYQDFALSWFKCAKLALKEPEDGDFVIVGDASQSVYKQLGFRWSDAGIKARGRSTKLEVNYRNTREMMIAAASFAPQGRDDEDDLGASVPPSVETCRRSGPKVEVIQCLDIADEVTQAARRIKQWIDAGQYRPHEIAILYARRETRRHKSELYRLRGLLDPYPSVLLAGDADVGSYADPGIKISTIYSSKGLQFPAVLVIWADLLPSNFPDRDDDNERSQFYVALTRAEHQLVITHSGGSTYVDELRNNLELPRSEAALGQPWLPEIVDSPEGVGANDNLGL